MTALTSSPPSGQGARSSIWSMLLSSSDVLLWDVHATVPLPGVQFPVMMLPFTFSVSLRANQSILATRAGLVFGREALSLKSEAATVASETAAANPARAFV